MMRMKMMIQVMRIKAETKKIIHQKIILVLYQKLESLIQVTSCLQFNLNNGKLETQPTYFIIPGIIDDNDFTGNFGNSPLFLEVIDNETTPSIANNVSCTPKAKGNKIYEFRCTPEPGVKGTIYLSTIKYGESAISLNMTEGDYANYLSITTPGINKGI